jgi:hypothetical protein
MPNQRATGQTLIGCHLDGDFVEAIDRARHGKTRSQFLREALFGYLQNECGIKLPRSIMYAPDRAGKGGRPKKVIEMELKVADEVNPNAPVSKGPVKYQKKGRKNHEQKNSEL